MERHLAATLGTVRISHRAGTISHQAAAHPKNTLAALNMKEEEEEGRVYYLGRQVITAQTFSTNFPEHSNPMTQTLIPEDLYL
jgi:hypothetical protein